MSLLKKPGSIPYGVGEAWKRNENGTASTPLEQQQQENKKGLERNPSRRGTP